MNAISIFCRQMNGNAPTGGLLVYAVVIGGFLSAASTFGDEPEEFRVVHGTDREITVVNFDYVRGWFQDVFKSDARPVGTFTDRN